MDGKAVVQLYVRPPRCSEDRPIHELKGFEKIFLRAWEKKECVITLDERSFAYFDEESDSWTVASGQYTLELGFSSRDIRKTITTVKRVDKPFVLTDCTTIGDVEAADVASKLSPFVSEVKGVWP